MPSIVYSTLAPWCGAQLRQVEGGDDKRYVHWSSGCDGSDLGVNEDILYGRAVNDGLATKRVMANIVSPTEIGCEC